MSTAARRFVAISSGDPSTRGIRDRVNVVLFGATGMVGAGVLIECLDDPRVESVLAVGRRSCAVAHPKLRELIRSDLFDYGDVTDHLLNSGPGELRAPRPGAYNLARAEE